MCPLRLLGAHIWQRDWLKALISIMWTIQCNLNCIRFFNFFIETFTVVPIEVFLKYWFNTLPQANQFISSSSSRYSYTSCERGQFQVFDHFWSLPFYLWLVSCTNNKGDWSIQTIQQEVYNFTRKCMNISRNLIKWIGQPEVMYWINIWGTLQLERQ